MGGGELSDDKPDDKTERMRRLYGRMRSDEMAFIGDFAHPFKGDGQFCEECRKGPDDPFHEKAGPEAGA
jgi:hypothetical protein